MTRGKKKPVRGKLTRLSVIDCLQFGGIVRRNLRDALQQCRLATPKTICERGC